MADITETDSRFLNELIRDTITFRLTTDESLKYIAIRFGRAISMPEIWLKTNFLYETEYNDKTQQMEKVLQSPSSAEEVYTMPFNKDNLISLFDIRKDENLNFVVKDEQTGKPFQVKDVNSQKTFELFQKPFEYLYSAEYIPPEVKDELRQAAAADNLIGGNIGDYAQPAGRKDTTGKNIYQ
jgi:hypothetical protein